MSDIFMSTENNKTGDPNRFRRYFTDKIDLRGNKKIALSDLSIHYTWHNIKEELVQLGLEMLLYMMVVMKYLKFKIIFSMK